MHSTYKQEYNWEIKQREAPLAEQDKQTNDRREGRAAPTTQSKLFVVVVWGLPLSLSRSVV